MKIHLVVDLAALGPALELAETVCDYIDSMWIGPALLKNEGLKAAEAFKTSFCEKTVVADMRTIEFGGLEAELAFGAGADGMTMLGIAQDADVVAAIRLATRLERQVILNLSGVPDPMRRARGLVRLGVQGFVVDFAAAADDSGELLALEVPVYVSGCDGAEGLRAIAALGFEDVLLGRAIYAADDVAAAARELRKVAGSLP